MGVKRGNLNSRTTRGSLGRGARGSGLNPSGQFTNMFLVFLLFLRLPESDSFSFFSVASCTPLTTLTSVSGGLFQRPLSPHSRAIPLLSQRRLSAVDPSPFIKPLGSSLQPPALKSVFISLLSRLQKIKTVASAVRTARAFHRSSTQYGVLRRSTS